MVTDPETPDDAVVIFHQLSAVDADDLAMLPASTPGVDVTDWSSDSSLAVSWRHPVDDDDDADWLDVGGGVGDKELAQHGFVPRSTTCHQTWNPP